MQGQRYIITTYNIEYMNVSYYTHLRTFQKPNAPRISGAGASLFIVTIKKYTSVLHVGKHIF